MTSEIQNPRESGDVAKGAASVDRAVAIVLRYFVMRNTSSHISGLYLIRFAFHCNESSPVSHSKQLCYSLNGIKYSDCY